MVVDALRARVAVPLLLRSWRSTIAHWQQLDSLREGAAVMRTRTGVRALVCLTLGALGLLALPRLLAQPVLTINLWEGKVIRRDSVAVAVAFGPDGKTLASGSEDQTVRLWDPATGKAFATLEGHAEPVQAVLYSPNGKVLASMSHKAITGFEAKPPTDPDRRLSTRPAGADGAHSHA
jgi:WD40 repeat protein